MAAIDDRQTSAKTASKPITGADVLVESLVRHGVDVVFAYPGGASMPLHQALTRYRDRIRTILPRHEQGGIFAAEGYARATGKPGVVMATSGPGALNLVTGLADAKMDSVPLVAITGQVPRHVIGTDAFQETPMVEVSRAITKHHYLVQDAKDIARIVKEAFHLASTGRPGPVLIDMPKDVQNTVVANPDYRRRDGPARLSAAAARLRRRRSTRCSRRSGEPASRSSTAAAASSPPDAAEELREFAAKTGIPVAMTVHGLGAIPSDHYLSLNMLGMHGTVYANYAVNEADLLLALGVRFDDRVTGKLSEFAKHGRIVHVDIDASEINKNKFAHIPVNTDVKSFLQAINPLVDARRLARVAPADRRVARQRPDDLRPARRRDPAAVRPRAVLEAGPGRVHHDDGRRPASDVGRAVDPVQASADLDHLGRPGVDGLSACPPRWERRPPFPDALVVDIDGDGSFLMNIQELATVYCEKLPVKVIVLNNQHLGMVVQWEDRFHDGNRAHTYLGPIDHPEATGQGEGDLPESIYPDFVEIARGFGVTARQIRQKDEVDRRPRGDDRPSRSVRARRPGSLPGARPADDPGGRDRARHHQELTAGGPRPWRPPGRHRPAGRFRQTCPRPGEPL